MILSSRRGDTCARPPPALASRALPPWGRNPRSRRGCGTSTGSARCHGAYATPAPSRLDVGNNTQAGCACAPLYALVQAVPLLTLTPPRAYISPLAPWTGTCRRRRCPGPSSPSAPWDSWSSSSSLCVHAPATPDTGPPHALARRADAGSGRDEHTSPGDWPGRMRPPRRPDSVTPAPCVLQELRAFLTTVTKTEVLIDRSSDGASLSAL
jgi:hypothetical protein